MIKFSRKIQPAYILVDVAFIAAAYYLCYIFRFNDWSDFFEGLTLPYLKAYSLIFGLWAFLIIIMLRYKDLHCTDRGITIPREIKKVVTAIVYASVFIAAFIFFRQYKFFSRQVFLSSFVLFCVTLSGWRVIKRLLLRMLIAEGFHNQNILIIGAGETGRIVLDEIRKFPWWGLRVVGFLDEGKEKTVDGIPVVGGPKDFFITAKKYFIDEVIITVSQEDKAVAELVRNARRHGLGVRIVPENFEGPITSITISQLGTLPLITYEERKLHPANMFIKRTTDFILSLLGVVFLSPLFAAIAFLIKTDSRGSVFYRQKRVGLKGMPFELYKFRSMVQDADRLKRHLLEQNEIRGGVLFKIKKDPRATRVGRFLRKYSLDELPQLFNVLKGDMSLVGPRPPTPDEVAHYNHMQMERLAIRPGITGLSQIKGRSDLTFHRWVKWDLWYMNNWSFGLDLMIIWQSIPVVLRGKGAY